MFCPKCGTSLQAYWSICPKCGTPVNTNSNTNINNNINTATNPTTQQQNNQFVDRSNTLRCGGKKRIKHK